MSFLRALSPARRENTVHREEPTLVLRVDDYGFLYLTRTAQPFGPDDLDPGYASEPFSLRGSLQVNVPIGYGRCRCKSVKVALKTTCRLAMGPSRGWEEDVIFEREEKVEDAEGVWFEEGSTKFEFAFTLPYGFPAMDWHDNAMIRHEMHAVVEGVPVQRLGNRFIQSLRSSSPSASPSRDRSRSARPRATSRRPSPLPSRSPSPPSGDMSALQLDDPYVTLRSRASLPQAPSYEEFAGDSDDRTWLEGTFAAKKNVRVIWNPNVAGNINSLDERVRDVSKDLGMYEVDFQAPLWTISCILHTRISFPAVPSSVTIFHVRVELVQSVIIRSPRDKGSNAEANASWSSKQLLVCSEGKRPSKDIKRPDVWKNPEAEDGGTGIYQAVMKGRLPDDSKVRPSTIDGHHLLVEVIYSVWNQDHLGAPLAKPGPGDQQTLSIARSVVLPGCTLIPERVSLPEYASISAGRLTTPNEPCPLCKMVPEDRFCTTCKYERPVHPRHDHHPKLVGNAEGVCPVCSVLVAHDEDKTWYNCACAMSLEEVEKLGEGIQRAGGGGGVQRWGPLDDGRKEEYERGRQL